MYKDIVITDPWKEPADKREKPYERVIVPLFGPTLRGVNELNANIVSVPPGSGTNYHCHVLGELIFIASGSGEALLGDEKFDLAADTVFWAPAGVYHHLRNTGDEPMKIFAVFAPGMDRSQQKARVQVTEPPQQTKLPD